MRYAVRCGAGNSLRVLTENPLFARAAIERSPEPIIREIAHYVTQEGDTQLGIAGLHFYIFGGFNKALDWIHSAEARTPTSLHT
jgi:hypothetical protein